MYGGDLSGGAAGGSSWKAPEDPTVVVGGGKGEDVSCLMLMPKGLKTIGSLASFKRIYSRIINVQYIIENTIQACSSVEEHS